MESYLTISWVKYPAKQFYKKGLILYRSYPLLRKEQAEQYLVSGKVDSCFGSLFESRSLGIPNGSRACNLDPRLFRRLEFPQNKWSMSFWVWTLGCNL